MYRVAYMYEIPARTCKHMEKCMRYMYARLNPFKFGDMYSE